MDYNLISIIASLISIAVGIFAVVQSYYYYSQSKKVNRETAQIDEYTYLTSLYDIIETRAMIQNIGDSKEKNVILEKDEIRIIKMESYKKTNADVCIELLKSSGKIKFRFIDGKIKDFLLDDTHECITNLTHELSHQECSDFISLCEKLVKNGIRVILNFK